VRIFPPLTIRWLRPGLNPRTWVPEGSTLTPRPLKPLKQGVPLLQMAKYHISSTFIVKDEMFRSLIVSQPSFGITHAVSTIQAKNHTVLTSSCKVSSFLFNFNQNGSVSILVEFRNLKFQKNPPVKTQ
jgi:hypothetical protein